MKMKEIACNVDHFFYLLFSTLQHIFKSPNCQFYNHIANNFLIYFERIDKNNEFDQ